jgi:Tol biopolymer transport system component
VTSRLRFLVICASALVAIAAAGAALSTPATFKGRNGRLVYQAQSGANTQLFTVRPDGTGVTQITHFKDSSGDSANWAPGSSRIVFTRHWDPGGPNERFVLYTANADGSGQRALPGAGHATIGPNWLDARRIIFLDYTTGVGHLKIESATGGRPSPAGIPGNGGDSACALPGGRVAFVRPKPGNDEVAAIFVAGLSGKGVKRITPWGSYADKIDCSPNGTRIVFSKPSFDDGGSNVYTIKVDGTGAVQLTHAAGSINAGADSWSPDGSKIAYVSNKTGPYQIWTMNSDGSHQKQLTHAADAHLAAWGSHA